MIELPATKAIKDVLDGLLGREVTTTPSTLALSPIDTIGGMTACYADDNGELRAVIGWSLTAGAWVGAALGLIPAPVTEEMVEEQFLRTDISDNLAEVCNVLAAAFEQPANPHVRLSQIYCPAAAAPATVTTLLYKGAHRLDLTIEVPGYGTGAFAVVGYL